MQETHVPLESVWSELLKKDQSGHPNIWKAPNYDVHQIWPSRKQVSNYILKTVISFVLENHRIRDKKSTKKYFCTFKINKITFTMVKGKRNGLTLTECSVKICQFLLLSPPYWKWSYHNATQSECAHRLALTLTTPHHSWSTKVPYTLTPN